MIRLEFHGEGDFEANNAAEEWCRQMGISIGAMQGASPRGLAWGDPLIAKWRNLDVADKRRLDGKMEYFGGGPRDGVAVVTIADPRIRAEIDLGAPINLARIDALWAGQQKLDQLGIGKEAA